jgi:hypothetical protein
VERELAPVSVLSGRAEVLGRDGNWVRLGESQSVSTGARLRTSVNGVAVLALSNGSLVLGRSSEVAFDSEGGAQLLSGEVALERTDAHEGKEIEIKCEEYTVVVSYGCAMVSRKLRGLNVRHAVGFAYLTHPQNGPLLLDGGLEADVDFSKGYGKTKALRGNLPDWSSDARTRAVMAAAEGAISAREWKAADRRFVDRNLASYVGRMMRYPVESENVIALLEAAIGNASLGGKAICQLVGEVENAFVEEAGFSLGEIAAQARDAALSAKDFGDWQLTFKLLLRPAPAGVASDGPDNGKPKSRDRQPPRGVNRPAEGPDRTPVPSGGEPIKKD